LKKDFKKNEANEEVKSKKSEEKPIASVSPPQSPGKNKEDYDRQNVKLEKDLPSEDVSNSKLGLQK
jgi:hypothetical protein